MHSHKIDKKVIIENLVHKEKTHKMMLLEDYDLKDIIDHKLLKWEVHFQSNDLLELIMIYSDKIRYLIEFLERKDIIVL